MYPGFFKATIKNIKNVKEVAISNAVLNRSSLITNSKILDQRCALYLHGKTNKMLPPTKVKNNKIKEDMVYLVLFFCKLGLIFNNSTKHPRPFYQKK